MSSASLPSLRKMDMGYGTWYLESPYEEGLLITLARETAK
jgi:hypothetical protein